ncbi:aminotransferase class IV [Leucobacter triazinivorans]|uniref:Aminotransferase class IV n=1 Tax=Leucobacter triazinivorans TaxID=1784719 RepID=A0A4P6KJ79_9MICO|nr:aminotransferase class IV [Leucobacter triazinivorans]QBE50088.1 hypothetical protein EVS81_15650 [Leucobacter triazinivorans]
MSAGSPRLLAADSFRVRRNPRTDAPEARGLELHLRRFTEAVLDAHGCSATRTGGPAPDAQPIIDRVEAFLAEARTRIAAYGVGFPRLELRDAENGGGPHELALALRPLPELRETITVRSAAEVRLPLPHRKGPAIARLSAVNRELGAEALLLDASGQVLEGATTSLVWWPGRGGATGCAVPAGTLGSERVDSVTERLLRAEAPLVDARIRPEALLRCEVWAVNALHGIRVVTHVDDEPLPAPDAPRLRRFRDALDRTWQAIEK